MGRKQLIGYLLLNVLVSAVTVWVVLTLWSRNQQKALEQAAQAVILPTVSVQTTEAVIPTEGPPERPLQPHQVRSGETLGDIAALYDTTVEDLMAINGFDDPNTIGAGQVIYVPAPTPAAAAADTTVTAAAPPEEMSSAGGSVQIVSVIGVGDLETERVLLGEVGGGKHVLAGWQLQDEDGHTFVFPQVTLYEGGQIVVNTRVGVDTPLELFWGLEEAAWRSGETVTLLDASGEVQATFQIP